MSLLGEIIEDLRCGKMALLVRNTKLKRLCSLGERISKIVEVQLLNYISNLYKT